MLKESILKMWNIVLDQVNRSKEIVIYNKKNLLSEINFNEKRIDSFELKIDYDVEDNIKKENIKESLSVLKINYNLERIGDYAFFISNIVNKEDYSISKEIVNILNIENMFNTAIEMLKKTYDIYEKNDKNDVYVIYDFEKDLNKLKKLSINYIYNNIKNNNTTNLLDSLLIINKLERMGDHIINIIEEIIFFLDSVVIKHKYLKDSEIIPDKMEYDIIKVNNIIIDKIKYNININGQYYNLPKKQFEIFYLLASNENKLFTREQILSNIWKDTIVNQRTIDVHIRKIRETTNIKNIISVKGVGYKFISIS